MEILIRNAEGNLSTRDKDYAAKKLGKLDRYFHSAQKVELVHREQKLNHKIEVTVFADGMTLRGEESDASLRAAIDKVADKLENRLKRLKGRIAKSHKRRGNNVPNGFAEAAEPESDEPQLIIKRFILKPMSIEEASLQMEMLDHPFFVFRNAETNQTEVLYKRDDGHYGLLSPDA